MPYELIYKELKEEDKDPLNYCDAFAILKEVPQKYPRGIGVVPYFAEGIDPEADITPTSYIHFEVEIEINSVLSGSCLTIKRMGVQYVYSQFFRTCMDLFNEDFPELELNKLIIAACKKFPIELNYLSDNGLEKYLFKILKNYVLGRMVEISKSYAIIWGNRNNSLAYMSTIIAKFSKKLLYLKASEALDNRFLAILEMVIDLLKAESMLLEGEKKIKPVLNLSTHLSKIEKKEPLTLIDIWELNGNEDKFKSYNKAIDFLVDEKYLVRTIDGKLFWSDTHVMLASFFQACIRRGYIKSRYKENEIVRILSKTFTIPLKVNNREFSPGNLRELDEDSLRKFWF